MKRVLMVSCTGLILSFGCITFADTLVLKQGIVLKGTITAASQDSVFLSRESAVEAFAKADVLTIVFSTADVLFMKNGEQRECKVVTKIGDSVIVAAASGTGHIHNAAIDEVKYNVGHELTVSSLPETGRQFVNKPSQAKSVWVGDFKHNITLRAHFYSHFASLSDWKSQFTGGSPSTVGLGLAGELGYEVSRTVKISGGFEYCFFPTAHVTLSTPNFDDKVSFTYIYGGIKIGDSPKTLPALFIYGGADGGLVRGTESITGLIGLDFEGSASVFAPRIKIGADYFLKGNFSISSELAYLFADVKDLKVMGSTVSNYSLNFSGVSLVAAFVIHLPIE